MAAGGAMSAAAPDMAADKDTGHGCDTQKPSLSDLPPPADFCLLKVLCSPKLESKCLRI